MARVLLIDDDADVREILRGFLEVAEHSVVEAENGTIGNDLLENNSFDIVITDIIMHGGEGLSTIMRAKRLKPEMKVIAISGVASKKDVLEYAQDAGADMVLEKPISMGIFNDAVERCLNA